jgi:hypothetical protein
VRYLCCLVLEEDLTLWVTQTQASYIGALDEAASSVVDFRRDAMRSSTSSTAAHAIDVSSSSPWIAPEGWSSVLCVCVCVGVCVVSV